MVKKKNDGEEFKNSLVEGLKYPWQKGVRLWNILWLLLPIFGWFALMAGHRNRDHIPGQQDRSGLF